MEDRLERIYLIVNHKFIVIGTIVNYIKHVKSILSLFMDYIKTMFKITVLVMTKVAEQ